MPSLEGRTIGVLSSLLAGVYFGVLISALARAAAEAGGRTIAIQTQNVNWLEPYRDIPGGGDLGRVGWEQIDGFVVVINSVPLECLQHLRATGKPVVLISHQEPGFACPVVVPDNQSGVREAITHLIGHGHRRIAFAGDQSQHDIRERYEAYRQTLVEHGIEPEEDLVYTISTNQEVGGREAAKLMLEAGLPSTAVFAATDYNALGIIAAFKEAGYSVPRDQAIVGFDDMRGADLTSPALSTIGQNFDGMGAQAVSLVAQALDGREAEPGFYRVTTSLLCRESCGCVVSTLPAAVERTGLGPVEAFTADVVAALAQPSDEHDDVEEDLAQRVASIAGQVGQVFAEATKRDLTSLELLQLAQLCEDFHGFDRQRAFTVLGLGRKLARQLEAEGGADPVVVAARLDSCVAQLGLGLSRAGVVQQVAVNDHFQNAVWNEYEISMELLRSHEKDPRSLDWMAKTIARLGVLALWASGPDGPELEVVGSYDSRGPKPQLSRHRYRPQEFPPSELVARSSEEDEGSTLVLVLPVRTLASDWGFLALVIPVGAILASQESYFQWSALLSQALEYDAVTASLRQRNEDLAFSYQREREMADAVKQSEERYALAARAANDGLWDWDLSSGSIYYSSRWKQMLGYGEDAIGTSPEEWFSRAHPDDRPALMETLAERRRGERGPFENEHRIRAADGTYRWVLCRGLGVPEDGRLATRLVGSLTDITERRSLEEQLVHQALYDSLTGLPNRALFLDRLSQSIVYARRSPGYQYAVLWLDLDGFKVVNDSLGHQVGDRLLIKVAERVSTHLRAADTAARFGGDEFAVLLHDVANMGAVDQIVRRLQDDLGRPYDLDGVEVVVTASMGISNSSHGYEKAEDVLRDADIAMYRAKSAGRAGHATFDESMYAGAISRLQTETALRQAIELGQLELHYQPIVALRDGSLRAMEALVRWRHPTKGLMSPAEFLPVAEESGLVVPMGGWVQMEACRQLFAWKSAGIVSSDLRVSINLSHREFWNPNLLSQVDNVLFTTGAPAEWVSFEITEGVIMHSLEKALAVLGELHARGIQIHIDDFGTGYSSLEALHRLPIDALKIDRSFVANLSDDKSTELVRTIVQLGRNLEVDVIAEGIETPAQQHALAALGCPLGQGYWFSVPVPAARLGELLSASDILPSLCPEPAQGPPPAVRQAAAVAK